MNSLPKNLIIPERFWFLLAVGLTFFTFLIGFGVCMIELSHNRSLSYPLLYIKRLCHLDSQLGRNFFSQIIPGFKKYRIEDDPDFILDTKSADLLLGLLVNIRNPSPQEMFKSQLPILSLIENKKDYNWTTAASRPLPGKGLPPETRLIPPIREFPESQVLPDQPFANLQILIYHSHTSESYLPVSGKTHLHNERGDVVKVGATLAKNLREIHGIQTIHCDTIHDHYPFRDAYTRSAQTVKQLLKENPEVELVLDIHRDATPGLDHKVKIGEKTAAKLIFVVGSERMGLQHPHWEKNYSFAKSLLEVTDRLYPNLAHGIILSEARYNQHLHPHSIIVEFGDEKSTWEEVSYSINLFTNVLVSYLQFSQTGYSM